MKIEYEKTGRSVSKEPKKTIQSQIDYDKYLILQEKATKLHITVSCLIRSLIYDFIEKG